MLSARLRRAATTGSASAALGARRRAHADRARAQDATSQHAAALGATARAAGAGSARVAAAVRPTRRRSAGDPRATTAASGPRSATSSGSPASGADALKDVELSYQRPYDLRHSFASLLLHEGRRVIYVARQLGHSARADDAHLRPRDRGARRRAADQRRGRDSRMRDVTRLCVRVRRGTDAVQRARRDRQESAANERLFDEWAVLGSNQRPPACKAGALPAELTARGRRWYSGAWGRRLARSAPVAAHELLRPAGLTHRSSRSELGHVRL